MLNFPIPYPDELLYSTIARAGIRHGLISPKQLLEEVFDGNRKVIATLDLPNHLNPLIKQLPSRFGIEELAYQHTLFPLYAPFIPEQRRVQCLQWMEGQSQGSIHLAMGVAASIIKTPSHIRYCPACLKEQGRQYGEYFWERVWQAPGVNCCARHGVLLNSKFSRPQKERHQFWPATPEYCPLFPQKPISDNDRWIAEQAVVLLHMPPRASPSLTQWTEYYRRLAQDAGLTKGRLQIEHNEITHRVLSFWSPQKLRSMGLSLNADDHCWLRSIFRKHRKSFSFLQHLVVHSALLPTSKSIAEAINEARSIALQEKHVNNAPDHPVKNTALTTDQQHWLKLLSIQEAKAARKKAPALYARLYRAQRAWITAVNKEHKRPAQPERKSRINWQTRDAEYLRCLQELATFITATNDGPRRSHNFWLKNLKAPSTLEKQLARLPLTRAFIQRYTETVADFQIRRLENTYADLKEHMSQPPRWRLLRSSGLSEQRLTPAARTFLNALTENSDVTENSQNQRHPKQQ